MPFKLIDSIKFLLEKKEKKIDKIKFLLEKKKQKPTDLFQIFK